MEPGLPLITTLAVAFGLALIFGFICAQLKIPTIVGYLLTGILIGPFTPGFVAHAEMAKELAEIGVMLLMFGVGLHFSISDLLQVRKIAVPGALLQILVATILGAALAKLWGWKTMEALIFGLALSVASTVVLLRALESEGLLPTINGRIATGWLVVEDLVMILVLVLLPPLANWLGGDKTTSYFNLKLLTTLGITIVKISVFIILIMVVGRRLFPKLLLRIARLRSRELFTLCVVTAAISIAFAAAKLFGVSFALGAFFAGMMMRESDLSHRVAEELLPLRDAFAVLFFVSVGMLFNPSIVIEQPLHVLAVVLIIIFGKSIAAAALVLAFRYPLSTALTVSASLAQIGEFSFILAALGVNLGLLSIPGQNLILSGALISIAANPLIFKGVSSLTKWLESNSKIAKKLRRSKDPLTELPMKTKKKYLSGQIVLVGYGRVGRRIGELFIKHKIPFVAIEQNRELVKHLRAQGLAMVTGDASDATVLVQAHVAHAAMLIIAVPNIINVQQIINTARTLNSKIEIVIRTHDEEESDLIKNEKRIKIFFGEEELAKNMGEYVLKLHGKNY